MSDTNNGYYSNRQRDVKISDMQGTQTLSDTDLLTVVQNGTNYKMTKADFTGQFGVTGSIQQSGDPLGVPVVDIQGSDNFIRNLEVATDSGLAATVSPQNGITLGLNAQSNGSGVPVLSNANKVRRILAGTGVTVAASGDDIVVGTSDIPIATRTVIINSAADFPDSVGNVIPLAAETVYFINDFVDVGANTFTLQNQTVVIGISSISTGITSSATGVLFDCVEADGDYELSNMTVDAANCTIVRANNTADNGYLYIHELIVESCAKFSEVTNCRVFRTENTGVRLSTGDVFEFFGTCLTVNISTILVSSFNGTAFKLNDAQFVRFGVATAQLQTLNPANLLIDGLVDSGNIVAFGSGIVRDLNIVGDFTPSSTVLPSDVRWSLQGSNRTPSSTNTAYIQLPSNTTPTALTVGVPTLVAGAWDEKGASRFASDAAGRITYIGEIVINVGVIFTYTAEKLGGGTDSYELEIYKNGSPTGIRSAFSTDASREVSAALTGIIDLFPNDFIEVFATNTSASNDLIVTTANLVLNSNA